MERFKQRLREPSTYAAIAAMLAIFGVPVPPGVPEMVGQVVAGAIALAGVVMSEKGAKDERTIRESAPAQLGER
jgi:flagellar biosynthesis component FlhA